MAINRMIPEAEYQRLLAVERDRDRLHALINTPELIDFLRGVQVEAVHQVERHGVDHDAGKTPGDWHWLVAHLAGRALAHAVELDHLGKLSLPSSEIQSLMKRHREKFLHHLITTCAAIANWHRHALGLVNMRPGINPAEGLAAAILKEAA